jgi:hypothetical protein
MTKKDKLDFDDFKVIEGTKFSLSDFPTEVKNKDITKE